MIDRQKGGFLMVECDSCDAVLDRQMLSLPGIEIVEFSPERSENPMFFRFDGGVGALMPLRSEREQHVDIKLSKDPTIT